MKSNYTMSIVEPELIYRSPLFKGRLLMAFPSKNRPATVSKEQWSHELISQFAKSGSKVVIPLSLDPMANRWMLENNGHGLGADQYVAINDLFVGHDSECFDTPEHAITWIAALLMRGEDVIVLSGSKKPSGFVPALFAVLNYSDESIWKAIWSFCHGAYQLTDAQKAYLAGLHDSCRYREEGFVLSRSDRQAGEEGYLEDELSLEEEAQHQKSAYYIRYQLGEMGAQLADQITRDLIELADLLEGCAEDPRLEESVASLSSVCYRVCEVFKRTSEIGFGIKSTLQATSYQSEMGLYAQQLSEDKAGLGILASQLKDLYESQVAFLSPDLQTVMHHPEIKQASDLKEELAFAVKRLMELDCRLDQIRCDALSLRDYEMLAADREEKKNSEALESMRRMLKNCMAAVSQKLSNPPQ